jgi:hypothetical protein
MTRWSKREREEILSKPFEVFPPQTPEMIKRGIPRGPLPFQRKLFLHLAPPSVRARNNCLFHMHPTTYDIIYGGGGSGKCLGIDTPILMYSGEIKPVQDIIVGDLLMGPDSLPRKVLSLARGREEMFKVIPVKGDPFVCNRSHILSLKTSGYRVSRAGGKLISDTGSIKNISIDYFLNSIDKHNQGKLLLYHSKAIEFPETNQEMIIDPYYLGLWLGDGSHKSTCVTSMDKEIKDFLHDYASSLGLKVHTVDREDSKASTLTINSPLIGRRGQNQLLTKLKDLNLYGNKHIPIQYLLSSYQTRLEILAGLIDSGGYLNGRAIEISQKRKGLSLQIVFLARSLGFAADYTLTKRCKKNDTFYYRVAIRGDIERIPIRVPRKKNTDASRSRDWLSTNFSLESQGEGDYYGFEIEGPDKLFLLGDFTVTHNTSNGAALGLTYLTSFPGCEIIIGAKKYKDVEKNVLDKYYRPRLSIKEAYDHPWVVTKPGEHNKKLELAIPDEKGEIKISTLHAMHFDDWERLRGQETSFIHFEEVSQMDDANPFEELTRRLRSTTSPMRQLYCTTNPPESMSHWIYDKWDFSPYLSDFEGERPNPKLCSCQFCKECLDQLGLKFPYDDYGVCTNPTCANIELMETIKKTAETPELIKIGPYPRSTFDLGFGEEYCPGNQNFYRIFMGNAKDNYALPAEVMQSAKTAHDAKKWSLYMLGEPGSLVSNKGYPAYSTNNVINSVEADPEKDIHWSHDINIRPCCSVIGQEGLMEINGVEEIVPIVLEESVLWDCMTPDGKKVRGVGPEHVAEDFINKYKEWNELSKEYGHRTVYIHGDHTALNNKSGVSPLAASTYQVMVDRLQAAGFKCICTLKKTPGVKIQVNELDRVNCVNWLLCDYEGNRRLTIMRKGTPYLRKSLEDLQFDKSSQKLKKKQCDDAAAETTDTSKIHLISHVSDALGYWLVRKWNLVQKPDGSIDRFVYIPGFPLIDIDLQNGTLSSREKAAKREYVTINEVAANPGTLLDYIKQQNAEQDANESFGGYFGY